MEDKRLISNFCKGLKTAGLSLDELYKNFSLKHSMPRETFELEMLRKGNKQAKFMKKMCKEYYENEGAFGYKKMCKEHVFVTKEFWDKALEFVTKEFWDKAIEKTQGKTPYLPSSYQITLGDVDLERDVEDKLDIEALFSKELPSELDVEALLNTAEGGTSKNTEKPVDLDVSLKEKKSDSGYSKLLPVDWSRLSLSDRLDFAKKIQHEGFRKYVLNLDTQIKSFFSKATKNKSEKLNIYVNLFQFPSDRYSKESKQLLRDFIQSLNSWGRANLQYVECIHPPVVEIREVR